MPRERKTGADPSAKELVEAKRIAALPKEIQRQHLQHCLPNRN
jgi:hypothetical protein